MINTPIMDFLGTWNLTLFECFDVKATSQGGGGGSNLAF